RVDNSHAVTNCHTRPLPGPSLPLQLLPGAPTPCPSHHEHLTGEGVDEVRDRGTWLSPAVRLIMGCLARHRGCVHCLPSCGQPGVAAAQARAPGAGMTPGGWGEVCGARADSSAGLGLRDGARRCRRPACRCGAPQPARGRAYLGWPPPGPGTWSLGRRLPPGSSEPPAAARCSAAAAGHGAGRP
ncbi:unnamed protein product, partial [Gulo gulo]